MCALDFDCGNGPSTAVTTDPYGVIDYNTPAISGSIVREGVAPSAVPEPAEATLLLTGLGLGVKLLRQRGIRK